MLTLGQIRKQIIIDLISFGIEESEATKETELILEDITGKSLLYQLADSEKVLNDLEFEKVQKLLIEREKRKPLQYCLGKTNFMGLTIFVEEGVFIPRVDTETVVTLALESVKNIVCPNILEIGVGSGAISIALLKEKQDARVIGIDLNPKAIQQSLKNAHYHKVADRLHLIEANAFPLKGTVSSFAPFDMVIANPPYISINEKENLDKELLWEPSEALFGIEADGLDFYRKIAHESADLLKSQGYLILEIGDKQGKPVSEILVDTGFWQKINIQNDVNNLFRAISTRKQK